MNITIYFIENSLYYDNGEVIDLGTLPGLLESNALDINNLGQVVGYSYSIGGDGLYPFLYNNGEMIDLNLRSTVLPANSF